jgi:hypothetical protein
MIRVMSGLLEQVLKVHGGLDNWAKVSKLEAMLSLGGPFWEWKGWPGVYDDQHVTLDPHREHITFEPFSGPGRVSVFDVDPEHVQIRGKGGDLLEARDDARTTFPVYENDTPWDALQVAYFASAATWNYLTAPFVFTYPGVLTREIDPWSEDGETWRRLAVTFPPSLPNHNAAQVFYYDSDFHQRRMDYQPDVTGSPIAHYTHGPRTFDGFLFYSRRLVHLRDENNVADQDFAPITIDVDSVELTRH